MSLFEKLNNKRYDLQEKKRFGPGSDGKVNVGGNRNQTSTTTTTTGRVGDLPVDDIPDMSNPNIKKKLNTDEKKIGKLLDKEGKKIDKLSNKIAKSTQKSLLTKKFKKPIKFVKKLKKYLKNPPSSTVLGKDSRPKYDNAISALDQNLSKLKQNNKAAKYTALINSTNKNRPEFEGDIPINKRGGVKNKFLKYTKRLNKAEKRPLGDVVSRVTKDRASRGLKIGDIDFKKSEKLAQQRAARIDPLTGKATKKGVENYILNRRNKSYVSDAQMKKNQAQAKKILSNPTGKEYRKIEKTINQSSYAGKTAIPATKKELKKTYKAIKSSKTVSATPLPKVYDPKASKELGTDVFRRIRKKLSSSKTRPGKVIDTPTRRVKLLKPTKVLKKIQKPELEKLIPKTNPKVTTTSFIGPSVPPKTTTTAATKLSKRLMKNKNKYAVGLGLALAGGLYLRNRGKNKEAEKKRLALLNVQKEKDKIQPMDVSLFLNRTGTSPNKIVDKSKQFTPSPYAYRPKNQPKPTYAKPTQYGSFDSKTKRMVQTTKKPKNINKNLP